MPGPRCGVPSVSAVDRARWWCIGSRAAITQGVRLTIPGDSHEPAAVAAAIVDWLPPNADIILPIANGEPVELMNEIEANAGGLQNVRVHQMHALRDRPYIRGELDGHLRHVSWFLSPITRAAFSAGTIDFAPANYSEVPQFLAELKPAVVLAAASPPDAHGYVSLGVTGSYTAALIGRVPFVLEINDQMPRTFGGNRLHIDEALAWCHASYPLVEVPAAVPSGRDLIIAGRVAERVPDGATMQLGIGGIPTGVASLLTDRKHLAIHTELFADPMVDLIESGAVTGINKRAYNRRSVATFALGTKRLYDFLDLNDAVLFLPVNETNDPRRIGREDNFVSINATLEVDLVGQCASETLGTRYFSGSGGQADFARGAQYSKGGDGYIVLASTTRHGTTRIVPTLQPGAVVTTMKNTVDHVVTEFGVATLRGRTLAERARALIEVAHPDYRDDLTIAARKHGLIGR